MGNKLTLINDLSGLVLDGRYTDITVVSCDPITGEHLAEQGSLSVVFRALDIETGKPVAIKFFDPDFNDMDGSRMAGFLKEGQLLQKLVTLDRCLHLVQDARQYQLSITNINGNSLSLPTFYVVIEWLAEDINDYFLNQQNFDALIKLQIFRQCVLSIFALHQNRIYHRDIKRDNLRVAHRENFDGIVAIDLGSAAEMDAPANKDQTIYANTRGARGYSSAEAICGLGGIRKLGACGDIYALGALLHNLFNIDEFYIRLFKNAEFGQVMGICMPQMMIHLQNNASEDVLLKEWHKLLKSVQHMTLPINIEGAGNSIPNAIKSLLNNLFADLVNLDYRKRVANENLVIMKIDAMIRTLTAARLQEKRNADRLKARQAKEESHKKLQVRLDAYLRSKAH